MNQEEIKRQLEELSKDLKKTIKEMRDRQDKIKSVLVKAAVPKYTFS